MLVCDFGGWRCADGAGRMSTFELIICLCRAQDYFGSLPIVIVDDIFDAILDYCCDAADALEHALLKDKKFTSNPAGITQVCHSTMFAHICGCTIAHTMRSEVA